MKLRRLTVKEAKLVRARAAGKQLAEAHIEAGYKPLGTKHAMTVNADRVLSKPSVQAALETALKKYDITVGNALAPVADALTHEGGEIDDKKLRLAGSDRALRLLGVHGAGTVSLNLHQHIHQQEEDYDL